MQLAFAYDRSRLTMSAETEVAKASSIDETLQVNMDTDMHIHMQIAGLEAGTNGGAMNQEGWPSQNSDPHCRQTQHW